MRIWVRTTAAVLTGLIANPALAANKAWPSAAITGVPVGADLRLRVLTVQSADPAVNVNDETSRLRKGFGGSMIDYFPFGADGFHISGGGRMVTRARPVPGDNPTAQLLYAPRQTGLRPSRRLTPAMTMGYSKQMEHGLTLGVEGGVLMGHLDSSYCSVARPSRSGRLNADDGGGAVNQIGRVTVAMHF